MLGGRNSAPSLTHPPPLPLTKRLLEALQERTDLTDQCNQLVGGSLSNSVMASIVLPGGDRPLVVATIGSQIGRNPRFKSLANANSCCHEQVCASLIGVWLVA